MKIISSKIYFNRKRNKLLNHFTYTLTIWAVFATWTLYITKPSVCMTWDSRQCVDSTLLCAVLLCLCTCFFFSFHICTVCTSCSVWGMYIDCCVRWLNEFEAILKWRQSNDCSWRTIIISWFSYIVRNQKKNHRKNKIIFFFVANICFICVAFLVTNVIEWSKSVHFQAFLLCINEIERTINANKSYFQWRIKR